MLWSDLSSKPPSFKLYSLFRGPIWNYIDHPKSSSLVNTASNLRGSNQWEVRGQAADPCFEDKGWKIPASPLKTSELSLEVANTVHEKDKHSVEGGQPRNSAQLGPRFPSSSWRLVSTLLASQNPVDYENRHPFLKSCQLDSLSLESRPSISLVFWNS